MARSGGRHECPARVRVGTCGEGQRAAWRTRLAQPRRRIGSDHHGQECSARVARDVACESRRSCGPSSVTSNSAPSFDDIDMYAAWAEDNGAKATLLIWDGMVHPGEYEALARQLRNRGRKVLIVGSAYVTDSDSSHLIDAPAELSKVSRLSCSHSSSPLASTWQPRRRPRLQLPGLSLSHSPGDRVRSPTRPGARNACRREGHAEARP